MGQGKSPWYTHRLMHRNRVTSELHDSYFRLMTIKHAIPKIEWAIDLLYNSVEPGNQMSWRRDELETRWGRESQQKAEPLGLRLSIRRTRTTHGYVRRGWWGQYVAVFVRSPTPSHTQTLQIKWDIYFFKEVFAHLYSLRQAVSCVYICIVLLYEYTTFNRF